MRYDLISPRTNKAGKTHWHKVGAAFDRDKGGFSLVFDSLPLPDAEGRVMLLMSEPLERRDSRDDYREKRASGPMSQDDVYAPPRDDPDSEIPF